MINIYRDIIIFGFFNFFLELFSGAILFARYEEKRKLFFVRLAACFVVGIGLAFLPDLSFQAFNADYLIVTAIVTAELLLLYRLSFLNALFYAIAAFALQHMSWTILLALIEGIGLEHFTQATGILLYLSVYLVCYLLAGYLLPARKKSTDFGKHSSFVLASSFLIVLIVYAVSALLSYENLWNLYCRIYAVVVCIFALCMQFGVIRTASLESEKEHLERDKAVLEELLYQGKKQQELSRDTVEIIERKCHDLKHQISALRTMNEADREKSIGEIEKAVMIYGDIAKTSNEVLNVVLTEKGLLCEKYKIKFTYIVDGDLLDFMDPVDLSTLFGNAIDNAIECVVKETDESKRVVKLNVSKKREMLGIRIENYCSLPVDFKDGLPVTSKENKESHGFGVKSIRYVAEKYGGTVGLDYVDQLFVLNILFQTKTANA